MIYAPRPGTHAAKAIEYLSVHGESRSADLAGHLGVNVSQLCGLLWKPLQQLRILKRPIGEGNWVVWRLPGQPEVIQPSEPEPVQVEDPDAFVHRVVSARDSEPLRTRAPRSVFEIDA